MNSRTYPRLFAESRALAWAAALLLSSLLAAPLRAGTVEYNEDASIMDFDSGGKIAWRFYPAVYGGYNQLLKGYNGYKNLGNVGGELWIRPVNLDVNEPMWNTNNFLLRVSGEWMPLQVPTGNLGLIEDMYALTGQVVFKFDGERDGDWMPYIGFGVGGYLDRLTLDTPASGKVTGNHYFFGVNGSAGFFFPAFGPFRLAAEARYHRLHGPDGFWPQNVTYQGELIYGFGAVLK